MENDIQFIPLISAVISVIGALTTIYMLFYKAKPERDKLVAEGSSSLAEAAESVAKGASISNELLLQRIEEMEGREIKREEELSILKRKLNVMEAELADWQGWAKRLVHQLKSYGKEPVSFLITQKEMPSTGE